jgi:hypothetical protein
MRPTSRAIGQSQGFPVRQRASAEVRVDAFNVFNRVNLNYLNNPSSDLSSSNFGKVTS